MKTHQEALEKLIKKWEEDLAYLDSIDLTLEGKSSRYTLAACISELRMVTIKNEPDQP